MKYSKVSYLHNFQPYRFRWLLVGLIAASLCFLLAAHNLEGVGLYYDEVNQAPSAFAYTGQSPERFTAVSIGPIPVMNASYIGALKSNLYGLYLRLSGKPFAIKSWRMTGILFFAGGLVAFSVIAGPSLPLKNLIAFLALLLLDGNVLLNIRHDYGPAALSLLLRLIFVALWIKASQEPVPRLRYTFTLGALIGLAIFEKVTALTLLIPLLIYVHVNIGYRNRKHWFFLLGGGLLGGLPLVMANLKTIGLGKGLISFYKIHKPLRIPHLFREGFDFLHNYFSLGQGAYINEWILGISPKKIFVESEFILLALLLSLVFFQAYRRKEDLSRLTKTATALGISYLGVGVCLFLLPYWTEFHHWILGTPFQYAAIALGFSITPGRKTKSKNSFWKWLWLGPWLLILLRLPSLAQTQKAIAEHRTGIMWDSSFNTLTAFAAQHCDKAIFIAADWGFANQIYSICQGRPLTVFEPFWDFKERETLKRLLSNTKKDTFYVLYRKFRPPLNPKNTMLLFKELNALKGWRAMPMEGKVAQSHAFGIIKFARLFK